jgi:hypothetical protein
VGSIPTALTKNQIKISYLQEMLGALMLFAWLAVVPLWSRIGAFGRGAAFAGLDPRVQIVGVIEDPTGRFAVGRATASDAQVI